MTKNNIKIPSKLTKAEALAELEILSVDIDFGDCYDDKTPLAELRQLVKEGREVNADDDEDDESEEPANAEDTDTDSSDDSESDRLTPSNDGSEDDAPTVEAKAEEEDYLRKYQYKKVNGNPVIGGKDTDPDPASKAEIMKIFLLSQPKIRIMIPVEAGSDPKFALSVNLNGYRLDLPRSTYLSVPEQVAEVVMQSQKQQTEALKPFLIDSNTADKALLG